MSASTTIADSERPTSVWCPNGCGYWTKLVKHPETGVFYEVCPGCGLAAKQLNTPPCVRCSVVHTRPNPDKNGLPFVCDNCGQDRVGEEDMVRTFPPPRELVWDGSQEK